MKPGEDTEEALWAKYSAPTKTAVATADDSEDALWAKYGGAQAATPPKRGIVLGSLARGIDNLQSSMYGAGALLADSADAIDAREFMLEGYFRNVREAQENPARIESFRKIEGVGDAFTYAIEGIFENIPSMIPSMVTGGGAYVLAGVGRKALAAGIGAYAGNWAQEAGSIYGDIAERTGERRPGTAAGYGAAAAALDTLSELMPLTKLMPLGEKRAIAGALGQGVANEIQRRLAARVARGAGQQFLTESATEAMQTAIEEAAVHHVDPSKPFWTAELMDRIVDAGLKGGIAGGALGGVAGAFPQEKPVPMGGQQEKPEDQKATDDAVRAANAALEAGAPQTAAALTEADVADIEEPVDVTPPVATEPEQPVDVTPSPEPEPTVDVTPPPPAEPEPPITIPQTQAELDQEGGVELETQEKGQEELPVAQPTTPAVTAPGPVEAPAPAQKKVSKSLPWRDVADAKPDVEHPYVIHAVPADKLDEVLKGGLAPGPDGYVYFFEDGLDAAAAQTLQEIEDAKWSRGLSKKRRQSYAFIAIPKDVLGDKLEVDPADNVGGAVRVKGQINAPKFYVAKRTGARWNLAEQPTAEPATSPGTPATTHAAEAVATPEEKRQEATASNPYDTSATSQRLTELRDSKPRPVDKLYGKNGGTPEQRSEQLAKIRKWNSEYRRAQKAHKEMVDKSNAWLASQKPAPVAPVATPAVAEVPTQQPDPIDAALTRAIDATSQRGEVNDFVKGVSYAVANAILRIARALYRGGRTLSQAIREAIRQYREDNPTAEFDDAELTQKLEARGEQGLNQDLVDPETATTPPTPPEPQEPASVPPAPPTPPTRQESGTPLKQSKALEFIRDPQFWYRAATDNGRREIAEDLARFLADDLEAAIQYLVSPPPSAGLRQDVQAASLAIIADTAMTRSLQATETFERGRLAAIGRHAIVQTKRIGSKMGQVLQGFGLTHDILGAGFFVADYQSWLEEKQRTAMSDEAAGAVAGAVKTHTTDPQQVANDRRSILEELAETDPMAAAVLELTEMGRGAFNLVTGKGFTPDYAKRLGKLFKNLPGWRDIYADKGGKKLDKLFWQLLRAGDDVQKSGSVDTMYKNVVSELSRLLRQALQASNDAKPINKFAELVRVMGEGQSRIEIILKLDEYIQQNAATLENADEILAAWDEAFGILRNPASKTTMRALLRDTIRGRETETDWDALFDSGQDGPAVRQLVDETIARLRAVETSETIDFEPLRAALLTEANAIRDAKFKLWEKRTRDVSTNKAKARTDGKRAIGRLERIINELRRDDIGISWREFFAQPVESQKDLTRKIFERLTEFGHLQRANRLDLANEIAAQLRIIFNVVAEVNIEREIKRLTKVPDDQRRIAADVVPELIRLSNAGVLDFSAARNAMAEKLGVKAISEATSQQIFEMGQAAQRRPAGSQRSEAYRKIFNLIQREAGISAWDVTKSFWYWGVLTGIGTQAANLMGSTSNLLLQLATYSARSPKDAARAFQAAMRGFRDSALQEFPAIFLRGAEPRRQRTDIEGAATTSEVMAEDEASKWNKIFKVQRYTTRFMMAVDQLLYDASHEVRAVMDVALKARESNPQITREAIDKQVADYLHLTANETRIARAQAQAEIDEGLTNPQDLERRTTEIIRQKRSLDLQETSNKFGLETTLNNQPDGVMGALYRIVISLREQYPIFWPLVPFAKISANVTNLFMTMSPIGMIMVLRNRPGAHQNWRWMEKIGIKHREMTVAEWQQLRASVALSNIVAIGILIAVLSEEDDEDPWIQVTGSMRGIPPNKKFQLQEMGVKPYQIKINGASFDYRLTPGAMLLAMIGNFMDARKYGKKDEDAWGPLEAVLSAGHGVIIDQQFLSGLAGLVSSGENAGKSMVTRLFEGAGRMTGGFIPSITKEIDSWVNPTIPQADGFLETFQRQVPVWRWSLDPPIRNALGEPIERPRLPWGRVVSFDKDLDPVWEVLREKSRAGVFIPTVSKAAKINGKPMTDAQFDKYQTITGRLYRQKLLADLPRLRRMTPAQTKEYFDKEFGRLREQARNQIR